MNHLITSTGLALVTIGVVWLSACTPPIACNPDFEGACPSGMVCDPQTEFCQSTGNGGEPEPESCGFFGCFEPEPEPLGQLQDTYEGFSYPAALRVHDGKILVVDQGPSSDSAKLVSLTPGGNTTTHMAGRGFLRGLVATGDTAYITDANEAVTYKVDLSQGSSSEEFFRAREWNDVLGGTTLESGYLFVQFDEEIFRINQAGDWEAVVGSVTYNTNRAIETVGAGNGFVFYVDAGSVFRFAADYAQNPDPVVISSPPGDIDRFEAMVAVLDDSQSGGGYLYFSSTPDADSRGVVWRIGFDGADESRLAEVGPDLDAADQPTAWPLAADKEGYAYAVNHRLDNGADIADIYAGRGSNAPVKLGTIEIAAGIALSGDDVLVSEWLDDGSDTGRIQVFSRP